ncbi:MAG: DUF2054 domain-containing protein [Methanobacteriota archaeon]|nr:MAG: DUF2054 domain-containing protein [Euryarchaeota archaeon]
MYSRHLTPRRRAHRRWCIFDTDMVMRARSRFSPRWGGSGSPSSRSCPAACTRRNRLIALLGGLALLWLGATSRMLLAFSSPSSSDRAVRAGSAATRGKVLVDASRYTEGGAAEISDEDAAWQHEQELAAEAARAAAAAEVEQAGAPDANRDAVHALRQASLTCDSVAVQEERMVDERGEACSMYDAEEDGCCPPPPAVDNAVDAQAAEEAARQRQQQACRACSPLFQCCPEFEACMTCCLSPAHLQLRHDVHIAASSHPLYRIGVLHPVYAGVPSLAGQRNLTLCAQRCRTSSSSTLHENTYRRYVRPRARARSFAQACARSRTVHGALCSVHCVCTCVRSFACCSEYKHCYGFFHAPLDLQALTAAQARLALLP